MCFHALKLANNFCHLTAPLGDVLAAAEGGREPWRCYLLPARLRTAARLPAGHSCQQLRGAVGRTRQRGSELCFHSECRRPGELQRCARS